MPTGVNNNLIPATERSKEELSAMGRKGQAASARVKVKKRNFREAVTQTLKAILPTGAIDDRTQEIVNAMMTRGEVPTVQDGVVAALYAIALSGESRSVDAAKLILAQAGEDVPEQHEIVIKAGDAEVRDYMG